VTKLIRIHSCKECPFHTVEPYPQLDEGKSLNEYFVAEQHICYKSCVDGYPATWWTDSRTKAPDIQERCPLEDE